jgi:hypothetical protein
MIPGILAHTTETSGGTNWPLVVGVVLGVALVFALFVGRRRLPWRPLTTRAPVAPARDTDLPAPTVPDPGPAAVGAGGVPRPGQASDQASDQASSPRLPEGSGIFISYRRQDEPNFAGRLYDRLATHFGRDRVFIDVDTIDLGVDFADVIDQSLSRCPIMIVVIGKRWIEVTDEDGEPRLDNPDDYVRLEIEKALRSQTRVIPVLVEGAPVPKGSQLPESLASLARRNGIAMSHDSFGSDSDRLIATLDRLLATDVRVADGDPAP